MIAGSLTSVTFENPNGSERGRRGDPCGGPLSTPAAAAEYLTDTYSWDIWTRE